MNVSFAPVANSCLLCAQPLTIAFDLLTPNCPVNKGATQLLEHHMKSLVDDIKVLLLSIAF